MMRVERPDSVAAFLARAGEYLAAREAEHNLILGLCSTAVSNPEVFAEPPRWAVVLSDAGPAERVVAAAIRTPPRNLVLSEIDDEEAVRALVGALAGETLPGVTGPAIAAAEFVALWSAATGLLARKQLAERVYRLTAIIAPSPTTGRPRLATDADRDLLIAWLEAFSLEALSDPLPEAPLMADRWIARIAGRQAWLWEADGEVVSFTGVSGPTPNGIRVGPVYTPPRHRRRGYAGNLVAAASQAQLDAGRRFVFLFTDLANPTSNHVYQSIGYEPVADVDQWAFLPRTAGAS
jgi:uncharacterized protein